MGNVCFLTDGLSYILFASSDEDLAHSEWPTNVFRLLKDWNARIDERMNKQTSEWLRRHAEMTPSAFLQIVFYLVALPCSLQSPEPAGIMHLLTFT